MFHKATKLEFKAGTILELTFLNGIVKRYDVSCLFSKYPQLKALEDHNLFTSGRLMGSYGIIWNDELDLEAETIYEDGETVGRNEIPSGVMVGCAVSEARGKCGISQKELSRITGIDQSDISKIERGVANPSILTLTRIADALDSQLFVSIS